MHVLKSPDDVSVPAKLPQPAYEDRRDRAIFLPLPYY